MVSKALSEYPHVHTQIHSHRVHAQIALTRRGAKRHRNLLGVETISRLLFLKPIPPLTYFALILAVFVIFFPSPLFLLCATDAMHCLRGALTAPLEHALE